MAVDEDVDEVMFMVVVGHGFDRGNYYGVNHGVQFKNTSGYKKWQDKEKNEKDGDEKE
ncbi:hypothetical protein Tco_1248226, partial [Tanacetum coccineum]